LLHALHLLQAFEAAQQGLQFAIDADRSSPHPTSWGRNGRNVLAAIWATATTTVFLV
jgi:hypothetical protein